MKKVLHVLCTQSAWLLHDILRSNYYDHVFQGKGFPFLVLILKSAVVALVEGKCEIKHEQKWNLEKICQENYPTKWQR